MGMYDTAYLPCAKCGKLVGFQSKSGQCILGEHVYPDIPVEILKDLKRDYNTQCGSCGAFLAVVIEVNVYTVQAGPKPDKWTDVSGPP